MSDAPKSPANDDRRAMQMFDAEQSHQRDDAALAVIVDAHGEVDVFDRRNDEQGPQDQRKRAERRGRVGMGAGVVEHGFQRVKRAGADIAEDDPERGQAHRRQARFRGRLQSGFLRRHAFSCFPSAARAAALAPPIPETG